MRKFLKASQILFLIFMLAFSLNLYACQESRRDKWIQPERVMDAIGVKHGMVIGEGGAGKGYFTFKLARRVGPTGKIYANDILERVLQTIEKRCQKEGVSNITTVLGKIDDPLFPEGELDMVILVMAFHDFEKPVDWMINVKPSMKSDATLVIVDKDPVKWGQGWNHFMTKEEILETAQKADYELLRIETFLERDNIYIFCPKPNRTASWQLIFSNLN
jgi:ubiquinone/menaquinone biosynthesis C-methylase UbiE